jgi:hypothetical protein
MNFTELVQALTNDKVFEDVVVKSFGPYVVAINEVENEWELVGFDKEKKAYIYMGRMARLAAHYGPTVVLLKDGELVAVVETVVMDNNGPVVVIKKF